MEPRLPPGSSESAEVRLRSAGASLAASAIRRCCSDAVRRLMERGVLQRAVGTEFRRAWYAVGAGSLVHRLWLNAERREFCSCRYRAPTAWANTRARSAIARAAQPALAERRHSFRLEPRRRRMRPTRRFPTTLLASSPTFHSAAVIELHRELAARCRDLRQCGAHGAAARGAARRARASSTSARAGASGARRFAGAGCG